MAQPAPLHSLAAAPVGSSSSSVTLSARALSLNQVLALHTVRQLRLAEQTATRRAAAALLADYVKRTRIRLAPRFDRCGYHQNGVRREKVNSNFTED